jgi:hypothetical protein
VQQSLTGAVWSAGSLSLQPPAGAASYAVFGLGDMLANGRKVPITLKVTAGPGYFLALSDYSTGRWRFVPYNPSGTYGIPDGASLVSPAGSTYIALVDNKNANFTQLKLTTNERIVPAQLELWFYLQTNLQVDQNLTAAIALLDQAQAAGYTKVLYADTKLEYIDLASSNYLANLALFKDACAVREIEIVPCVMSPGYANGTLIHNPNLIEGQPVQDALFQVSSSLDADVVPNPSVKVTNGDFEAVNGDSFNNWNQMDGPGVSTFADTGRTGGTSIRFENFTAGNPAGNDRIQQTIQTEPWQVYSVNFWLKTDAVAPVGQLWARAFSADPDFRQLTFNTFPIASSQDWTQYHLIFNSQDKYGVYLYLGIWGGQQGRFWIDDVDIEHAGLINLIRRPGAPFKVTSEDGATVYTEGVDFYPVADPLMGQVGYQGNYDFYHARPKVSIPVGGTITKGSRFKVSYYHAAFTDDLKPALALGEDEVFDSLADVVTTIKQQLDPAQIMIGVDEHRVAGWSEPSFSTGMTAGQELAAFSQRCDQLVRGIDPNLHMLVWSDMYDPQHNMVPNYYLARGGTQGAADGLPASWDIANWNSFSAGASLAHFAAQGNWQVLSAYYDQGAGFETSLDSWLDTAQPLIGTTANGGCVSGVMYTTWYGDYSQLDEFAAAVRAWEAAQ